MKTILASEFRGSMKKYLDLAKKERIVITRRTGESFFLVPVEEEEEKGYNPNFVKKILARDKSVEKGNITKVKDINDIWESIL